ncbi:MAG: CHAT domain-containing protein [Deltaproteobacteria bacterium]|nr:CHAT domain-containing protein [Deltaproteobacteria bacterium]
MKHKSGSGKQLRNREFLLLPILFLISCASGGQQPPSGNISAEKERVFFTEPGQLTAGTALTFSADLSAKGDFIVYTSDRQGNLDIWTKRSSGGFARPLTWHASDDKGPAISPDGKKILFVSRRLDAAGDIVLMPILKGRKSEENIQVFPHEGYEDSDPAWFPDGKRFVFVAGRNGKKPQLMISDTDSGEIQALDEALGVQPAVFPDGERIIFVADGALKVYHSTENRISQLTEGGLVQDASPAFSDDGRYIVFTRYADDTNQDGQLNADDHPTIWIMSTDRQNPSLPLESFHMMPLSSAKFSSWKPVVRHQKVWFSKQTGSAMNLFFIPSDGQASPPDNLEEMKEKLSLLSHDDDKIYYLRRSASAFFIKGRHDDAGEAALSELMFYANHGKEAEAGWLRKKIQAAFPDFTWLQSLADLVMLELRLNVALKNGRRQLPQMPPSFTPQITETEPDRVHCYQQLLRGKILTAHDRISEAAALFESISDHCSRHTEILAEASFQRGRLLAQLSGSESAISAMLLLTRNLPGEKNAVTKAARLAVQLTEENKQNKIAALHLLREQAKGLPLLPAMAHLRIGELFASQGKEIVAANEYRVMIEQYPESPEVLLQAATQLSSILQHSGRLREASAVMQTLYQQLREKGPEYREQGRKLLRDVLGRRGYQLLLEHDKKAALENFRLLLTIDPGSYVAVKGLLRIQSQEADPEADKKRLAALCLPPEPTPAQRLYFEGLKSSWDVSEHLSPSENLQRLDDSILSFEQARDLDDQAAAIHQALGWAYQQKAWWIRQDEERGGMASVLGAGWNQLQLGSLAELNFDIRVLNPFREEDPDWLESAIDSWLAAAALAPEGSLEQVQISQNLANAYYEKNLFQQALRYFVMRIQNIRSVPAESTASEALLWQRAGRTAWQVEENDLSINFFRRSTALWQQSGQQEQLLKTQDSLALSLRSGGYIQEAANLYEAMLTLPPEELIRENRVRLLLSLSQCYQKMEQRQKALDTLNSAEELLKTLTENPIWRTQHLLVLESVRGDIWKKSRQRSGQIRSMEQKILLLRFLRDDGIKREDKEEAWYAQELAYALNQLGFLQLDAGHYQKAAEHFQEASDFSELMYEDRSKTPPPVWLANLFSLARVQLKRWKAGALPQKELSLLKERLRKESAPWIRSLSEEATQDIPSARTAQLPNGHKNIPDYIPELLSLYGMVLLTSPDSRREGSQSLAMSFEMVSASSGKKPLPLLAESWLNSDPTPAARNRKQASASARQLRKGITRNPLMILKYLIAEQLWEDAWSNAETLVEAGLTLPEPTDRMLLRDIYEARVSPEMATGFSRAFQAFSDYRRLRDKELFNRIFPSIQQKGPPQEWKNPLSKEKTVEALRSIMNPGDMMLSAHYFRKQKQWQFLWLSTKAEGIHSSAVVHSEDASVIIRQLSSRLAAPLKEIQRLYIIPSDEAWDLAWETLESPTHDLRISYLPSYDALPTRAENQAKPDLMTVSDDPSWLLTASASFMAAARLLIAERSEEARLPGFLAHISHRYLTQQPLQLKRLNGTDLSWRQTLYSSASLNPDQIRQMELPELSEIIFTQLEIDDDTSLSHDLPEHWQTLWYSFHAAGASRVLIPWTKERKQPVPHLKLPTELAGKLSPASVLQKHQQKVRMIGPFSPLASGEEQTENAEELADIAFEEAEEAASAGDYNAAARQWLRYLWYIRKTEEETGSGYREGLSRLAINFYMAGWYQEALQVQSLIISLNKNDPDAADPGRTVMNAANFALLAEEHDDATQLLKKAEVIFTEEDDQEALTELWRVRGILYDRTGDYPASVRAYLKSADFAGEEGAAAAYRSAGSIYQLRLNEFDKALDYFHQASDLYAKDQNIKDLITVLSEEAATYISLGQATRALAILEEALKKIPEEGQHELRIRILQGLGIAAFRAGRLNQVLEILTEVNRLIEALPGQSQKDILMKSGFTIDRMNLQGMLAAKNQNFKEAFRLFSQALKMAKQHKMSAKEAFLLNNYGFWLRESGDAGKSLEYFRKAFHIDRLAKIRKDMAFDLRNMGLSELVLDYRKNAENHLRESLEISQQMGILYNLIYCHFGLGDLYRKQKLYPKALEHFRKAGTLATGAGLEDFMWKSLAARSLVERDMGEKEKAVHTAMKSIELIESLSPGLQSGSSVTGLSSERGVQEVYDELVFMLVEKKEYELALDISERSKKRFLTDSLGAGKQRFAQTESSVLFSELKNDLGTLQLLNIRKRKEPEGAERKKTEAAFESLKKMIHNKMTQLRKSDPQAWKLFRVSKTDFHQVRQALAPNMALLNYHITKNAIFLWLLRKEGITFRRIDTSRQQLHKMLSDYQEIIENYSATGQLSRQLGEILIAPVTKELSGIRLIGMIPHGPLQQLSFASLTHQGEWLSSQAGLFYLELLEDFLKEKAAPSRLMKQNAKIFAMANPETEGLSQISFAQKEVEAIARSFPNTTIYHGKQAKKSILLREGHRADILHLAVHGRFSGTESRQHALYFSGKTDPSAKLSPSEIFSSGLNPYLVTLSACESGKQESQGAGGFLSFSRAFYYSGARMLLSALWRLDDISTAVLMKRFYRELSRGTAPWEALSRAQTVVRRYFPHPAFWAAFRLSGAYL